MKPVRLLSHGLLALALSGSTLAFADEGAEPPYWGNKTALMTGLLAGAVGGYLFLRNTDSPSDLNAVSATLAGAGIGMAAGMTVSLFMGSDSATASAPHPVGLLISKRF